MNVNYNMFFHKNQQIIHQEKLEQQADMTAKNEEIESSFGIPLMIVGNKMDSLDQIKDV